MRDIARKKSPKTKPAISEPNLDELMISRLAAIVESSDDAIIGKTLEGVITSWNRGAENIYGYTAREMLGTSVSNLIPPARNHELTIILQKIGRGDAVEHYETERLRKDGQIIKVSLSVSPIKDSHGIVVGASTIARDVTARKRAEAEISALVDRELAARREAEVVRDANIALTKNLSLENVLETLLSCLSEIVPYDSANVMLLDQDGKFVLSALRGHEKFTDVSLERTVSLDPNMNSRLRKICETRQSALIGDTNDEPAWQRRSGSDQMRNWLGVPLIAYGQVIGVYSLNKAEPYFFKPEHVRLAESLAPQAASAIQNAQLFETARHHAAKLEELIAERELAEAALRESEQELRLFNLATNDMFWKWDLTTTQVSRSVGFERALGYTQDEIVPVIGWWEERLHPDDREKVLTEFRTTLQRGDRSCAYEYRFRRSDDSYAAISDRIYIVRDQSGNAIRALGAMTDVTERKKAEELLRQSENQLIEAQSLAHIGSWTWNLETNERSWSDELFRIFGLNPGGDPPPPEYPREIVHPEDRDSLMTVVQNSLEHGEPFSVVYRIIHADGAERTVHSRGNVTLDENGKALWMFGTAQDITEQRRAEDARREAEQKYREIFENAGEGIFRSTPEGHYLDVNPALAEMYGYESAEELMRDCNDISKQIYVDSARRTEFMRLMEKDGTVTGFQAEAFRRDGSKLFVSVSARAIRDDQGKVLYYEGIIQNTTERRRAETTSAAFAALAHWLSGARTYVDAGRIIAKTARHLFDWDACNLDLYDSRLDLINPLLNIDLVDGKEVNVTPLISCRPPTARGRRILAEGPELVLREPPIEFDQDAVPFGDIARPSASLMSVPIKHGEEVVGLLSIQSYKPYAYDQAALDDFVALAEHCGEAINRICAEQALRESEERYRDLVENSHELICTHDLDGLILSANRAASVALGYDLDAFVGKKNIRDILAPEVRDQFVEYMAKLSREGATGGLMVVQTSSGEKRIWDYYNSLRTEGVAKPIVRGVARDITEQLQAAKALSESEERYREFFENSRDAIYVHDLNGRYVSVNRAAEELSGFTREEIMGRHYSNFISPGYLKDARKNFCAKLDVPVATTYEAEVVCKNGTRKPVEICSRVIHKGGAPIGIQGTVRDITEGKKARDVLQNYSRRLLQAHEAERQHIARELHDEIGQILTAVRLNLQSVKDGRRGDESLPRIDEGIEIVDEALTKIRELSLELRPSLLDDLGLAAALRWYVERFTARSGIVAAVTGDSEIGRIPHDVETACFRIAQEALTNTARHAGATKASVNLERQNGVLCLDISDNGIGFDSDRYLDGSSSASALGLRGIQERTLAIRGRVELNSAPGKGTQIIVRVPLKR